RTPPRPELDAAPHLPRGRRGLHVAALVGDGMAVQRGATAAARTIRPHGVARPAAVHRDATGDAADPRTQAAAGSAVERQYRTAVAHDLPRPRPHRALGMAHARPLPRTGAGRARAAPRPTGRPADEPGRGRRMVFAARL